VACPAAGDDGRPQAAVVVAVQRAAVVVAVQKAQADDLSIASTARCPAGAVCGWEARYAGASTKAQAREFEIVLV
jgi:hypothetical protein